MRKASKGKNVTNPLHVTAIVAAVWFTFVAILFTLSKTQDALE
jgi:hypothetical protein